MSRPLIAGLALAAALAAMTLASPRTAFAAPDCSAYANASLMSWPAADPAWEFCWRRPTFSQPGPEGSGIELFEVSYNGHLVFDRLNMPILNVEYGPGGCGCFRDWLDQEVRFQAVGLPCNNGYCEVIDTPVTVCDCAPDNSCDANPSNACNVDVGSFTGVAADKQNDRLILTSQAAAGWYRYSMRWSFYLDGSIEPEFGFGSVPNGCTDTEHVHHGYYRLDFDIEGAANDQLYLETRIPSGADTDGDGVDDAADNCTQVANADQRDSDGDGYGNLCDADLDGDGAVNFVDLGLMKEAFFTTDPDADLNGDNTVNFMDLGVLKGLFFAAPGPSGLVPLSVPADLELGGYAGDIVAWRVEDTQSGRGYRLLPGAGDHKLAASTFDPVPFAKGDYWALAEHPEEIDDQSSQCSTRLDNYLNGENIENTDLVLWYRVGNAHKALDECYCGRVGPRLVPVGNWSPSP